MPTTPSTINYYIAADGTLRDGSAGSIAQTPRIYYGTEYAVTLSFPPSTIAEGDQLQVAVNRSRTFFSSASATGDAPVAAVAKHDVTSEEASAQAVTLTLSTNTRAMIDQVNGIDHPVRGFFGVHVLKNQSFVTLAVADAFMMSVESGPDAISPSLPVVDYPTREEAEALTDRSEAAAERAEEAAAGIVPPLQLSSPPTTSTVGSVGQLAVWHDSATGKDHLYHLCFVSEGESTTLYHWEECVLESARNVAGGFAGLDAQGKLMMAGPIKVLSAAPTNQTSADFIGQLGIFQTTIRLQSGNPVAWRIFICADYSTDTGWKWFELCNSSYYGTNYNDNQHTDTPAALKLGPTSRGISTRWLDGTLWIVKASNININQRLSDYLPVVPSSLDYAVRSVLPLVTEIPAATSDYSLVDSSATTLNHSHTFSHVPTQAPTYRLPSVSDTTVSHYIELTVDFTNVQTYSFLDANGDALVPLFTPSIAAGDVYTFKMEYSAIKAKWLIYPQKQGAVADDFVMRGEVGAANGVAGLDSKGTVPYGQIPVATHSTKGGVIVHVSSGHKMSGNTIAHEKASDANIDARTQEHQPIVPSNLNYAVTAALTDNNKISLTDEQKAAAQEVFGVGGAVVTIPAATTEYTLSWGRFAHSPSLASVYKMPAVADGSITNDITLSIKFSASVLTYEFQDSAGTTLVPLPLNGDIEAGSVVTFLCRYNPLLAQWVIYPVMDGKEAE